MFQKIIIGAAWGSIVILAYATLTHVGFVYSIYYSLAPVLMWPAMRSYAHVEHVIAFAIFGALFSFAYPKRIVFVCCLVFLSAVILEYLQTLTPDRHGTPIDAFEKTVGGALGIFTVRTILYLWRRKRLSNVSPPSFTRE
jgi:VanZ family protein